MSYVDSFETYALGASTDILAGFPLSDPGTVRTIITPGKDGGRALLLAGHVIRRGVGSAVDGRALTVRFGGTVFLEKPSQSHLSNNAVGAELFSLQVTAQKRVIRDTAYTVRYLDEHGDPQQTTRVPLPGDVILCYDRTAHAWLDDAQVPDDSQVTGVLDTFPYRQTALTIGISSDGCVRVTRGLYPTTAGGESIQVNHSSAYPGALVPFNVWVQLEFEVFMGDEDAHDGYVKMYLDNALVMTATNLLFVVYPITGNQISGFQPDGATVPLPESGAGCEVFNADNGGFHNIGIHGVFPGLSALDDFFIFADPPITTGVPVGDLKAVELSVTADADIGSTIVGSAPAATAWESVETEDGDVTAVALPSVGAHDLYAHAALASGDVKFLRVEAVARALDDAVTVALAIDDGATRVESDPLPVPHSTDYTTIDALFATAPDASAWDVTKVNAATIGAERTA